MKVSTSTSDTPPATHTITTRCPSCRASVIITAAKSADAESYSRCALCGEVWNVGRSQPQRHGSHTWR